MYYNIYEYKFLKFSSKYPIFNISKQVFKNFVVYKPTASWARELMDSLISSRILPLFKGSWQLDYLKKYLRFVWQLNFIFFQAIIIWKKKHYFVCLVYIKVALHRFGGYLAKE